MFAVGRPDTKIERTAFLPAEDVQFLEGMAAAVMNESRVPSGAKVGDIGPNVTGGVLIRPGGRDCYPALWIRDYAMSLESGLVAEEEQLHMLMLTAAHQQDTEWRLPNGSVVICGSIPDHIAFSNKPIFYPGTLEDYTGQGGPRWGRLPCLDDAFFFIDMAGSYIRATGQSGVLDRVIDGRPLLQRLNEAYAMPPSRGDSRLVHVDSDSRGVTFGFVDAIIHTGDLLFCSLLKRRAALELAEFARLRGDNSLAKHWREEADELKRSINRTFADPSGLLLASTGDSNQPDVWGTAFAVYTGALTPRRERAACRALANAYRAGTLAWRGNIRHVLTTDDFSETTAWQNTDVPKNRYQNGAYWGTPTGWVAYAIAKVDRPLASQLALEYIAELREGDFRKGAEYGSPWECMHPSGHRQNPVYLATVTCPLAAFRRIEAESARGFEKRNGHANDHESP